MSAVVDR